MREWSDDVALHPEQDDLPPTRTYSPRGMVDLISALRALCTLRSEAAQPFDPSWEENAS